MPKRKPLSPAAEKLFARVKAGRWYNPYGKYPKAMQELIDARLVQIAGRVEVIKSAFVPTKGFRPLRVEHWSTL